MIIQVKILLQKLWVLKLEWDDPVPSSIFKIWKNFVYHLSIIDSFNIPRQVTVRDPSYIEVHGFCDASINAFGACIYVRSITSDGLISSNLLCAKSRVASLKAVSLPRLELCGALLLARLMKKVLSCLSTKIDRIFYHTDSTIVLSWLLLEPRQLKTYLCNRISEIQQLSNTDNWYHISSALNPADAISRGLTPKELQGNFLWWHGPYFLLTSYECLPSHSHIFNYSRNKLAPEISEFNSKSIILTAVTFSSIFNKFSCYNKLINVTAYCLRFINNCKPSNSIRITGRLTLDERHDSVTFLIGLVQGEEFGEELHDLKTKSKVKSNSKLGSLNPFIDNSGIIRVGGRLKNSNLKFESKHPILLPSKHQFTTLLITYEHVRNFHSGSQATLSFIRLRFWPIHGKNEVKKVIRRCVICYKQNLKSLSNLMGDLPSFRVNPSRPFLNSGVNYTGPFLLKDSKFRNKKLIKCYVCVFVCLATKALHLELVSDLTTQGFLCMLKRFVSRRGLCQGLYSDNGTNFRGANREIMRIYDLLKSSPLQNYLGENMIKWHFIPSRSPHFGGVWEGAIKSMKHNLRRIINDSNALTYEEFYTYLVQVEAILNSRPLVPLTNDPNDFEALTPGHFLVGHPLNAVPDLDLRVISSNRLTRYQHLQAMLQHLWSRWSNEYLHTLHQRSKWKFKTNVEPLLGSLVLLKNESNPPCKWTTGRITSIHPGKDGVVRVVSVLTPKGQILKQSIVKVCVLPINDPSDN